MLSVVAPLTQCWRPGALCLVSGRLPSAESSAFLQVSPGACSNYITLPKRCFALVGSCLTRKHKSKLHGQPAANELAYLSKVSMEKKFCNVDLRLLIKEFPDLVTT